MYYYTDIDRTKHLQNLVSSIEVLVAEIKLTRKFTEALIDYESACVVAKRLAINGYIQADLSELSRRVPRLFWLHKDWYPPQEENNIDGITSEPAWFRRLEPMDARVQTAAMLLKTVGYY